MQGRLAGIYPDMGVPAHWWGSSQAEKSSPGSHQTSCCVLMVGRVGSLQGLWNRGMMTKLPLLSCVFSLLQAFVCTFSKALQAEYKRKGIIIQVRSTALGPWD